MEVWAVNLERWRVFGTEALLEQYAGYLHTTSMIEAGTLDLNLPGLPSNPDEAAKMYRDCLNEIETVLCERGHRFDA